MRQREDPVFIGHDQSMKLVKFDKQIGICASSLAEGCQECMRWDALPGTEKGRQVSRTNIIQ